MTAQVKPQLRGQTIPASELVAGDVILLPRTIVKSVEITNDAVRVHTANGYPVSYKHQAEVRVDREALS